MRANTSQTKLRSIVSLVEAADSLKSEGQSRMENLANKDCAWNFLLAGLVAFYAQPCENVGCAYG